MGMTSVVGNVVPTKRSGFNFSMLLVLMDVVNVLHAVLLMSSVSLLLLMVIVPLITQSNLHGHTCTLWPLRLFQFKLLVTVNLLTMPTLAVHNQSVLVNQMMLSMAVNRLSKLQITIYNLCKMSITVQFST